VISINEVEPNCCLAQQNFAWPRRCHWNIDEPENVRAADRCKYYRRHGASPSKSIFAMLRGKSMFM
jgi:hypothetical protein